MHNILFAALAAFAIGAILGIATGAKLFLPRPTEQEKADIEKDMRDFSF